MKLLLTALLLLNAIAALAEETDAEPAAKRWLPIVATRSNLSEALDKVTELQRGRELTLVATDDCHNLRKGLYIVVAGIQNSRVEAESAITEWRKQGVHDAYLRRCDIVKHSRLDLGIPLLHASFMQHPIEAINWSLQDAVSRVVILNNRFTALIIPRYVEDPEDIREGLRIGVLLNNRDQKRSINLSTNCIDPEFALNATHLAMSCVNESAGTNLLHRTQLYTLTNGQVVAEKNRCRQPAFQEDHWVCQKESVDALGVLKLEPNTLYP